MDLIIQKIENNICTLTLNRPESLNALNAKLLEALSTSLSNLKDNTSVRTIIITGSGSKAFVAGADIKEFQSFNQKEGEKLAKEGQNKVFDYIENYPKPIIAAINGFALGGGLELAMACHIRIASDTAKMGLPEVTLGLIPGYGGTQRLPKLIGKGRAIEAIVTAEMFTAEKALSIGLVNHVVSMEELQEFTVKIASKIARNSPLAIQSAIEAINASDTLNGFQVEQKQFGQLFQSEDFKEGIAAFLEKRKPIFS